MISAILFCALLPSPKSAPYAWRSVEMVGGGFVSGIITHPKARDLVYARTDIGGAYRWDARANRWVPLQDWLTRPDWNLYGVESVGLDPSDPNRLYIAAGTYTNEWGGNGAILVSQNRGRTFRRVDLPFKNGGNEPGRGMGERLAVDPNQGRIVYFGTRHEGLWRSLDHGATWRRVESFPIKGRTNGQGVVWVVFDPRSGRMGEPSKTLFAGTGLPATPLYRSLDAGATWTPIPNPPPAMIPHHAVLDSHGVLTMALSNGPGPNDVTDGAVWQWDSGSSRWTDISPLKPKEGDRFGYAGLSIDANDSRRIIVSTLDRWTMRDTVFLTVDGGKSWTSLGPKAELDTSAAPYLKWGRPEAEFGHWIADVEIDPFNPSRAWYVTGATIWRTENLNEATPTRWAVGALGLEETAVIDLASPPSGPHVVSALGDIAGFRHDAFDRSPAGGMWTNPTWSTTEDLDYAGLRPNLFIRVGRGSAQRGAISDDGATTWTPFARNLPGLAEGSTAAISADGRTIVWAGGGGRPYYSTDRGGTWALCEGDLRGRVMSDKQDPRRFYLYDPTSGKCGTSLDGGASFLPGASGLPVRARRMVPVFDRAGHVWLPTLTGLYRSTDGAQSFRKLESIEEVENVGFGKAAPGARHPTVFAIGKVAGVQGVYRSVDEGASWVRVNDRNTGFGVMEIIEGDPKVFGRVYLGTNGRGVLVGDPRPVRP